MGKIGGKIEVDFVDWHRMKGAIEAMQGQVFFVQDKDGCLRRWYPPRPPKGDEREVT